MKKHEILSQIVKVGVVAVIRGNTWEDAIRQSHAAIQGGVTNIEITFTTPQAHLALQSLHEQYKNTPEIIIGAGTILDAETARIAILHGAQFIVSPYIDDNTIKLSHRYGIPCMPGTTTLDGVVHALELGVDVVKIFPGEVVGISMLKAIRGPLPQAQCMPTGGVSVDNVADWLAAGAVAVGAGGALAGSNKTNEEIISLAKQFVSAVEKYRASQK